MRLHLAGAGDKNKNMEVRKWTTVDIYYVEAESEYALRERKRLEKIGYEYQQTDSASHGYDYCDQYIKSGKTRYTVTNK